MMGIVKDIIKIVSIIGLVIAVIVSVFGFIAVQDAREFKERFPVEPNLFLLVESGDVLAGVRNLMHETPQPITDEEKADYQQLIDNEDYESLVGSNYRVFLVHTSAFDSLPEENLADSGFSKAGVLKALRADETREWFINESLKQADIPDELMDRARQQFEKEAPSEESIRSTAFLLLLGEASQRAGPVFIIEEYKKENMDIYPKTMMFRFIKLVPDSVVQRIKSKMSVEG